MRTFTVGDLVHVDGENKEHGFAVQTGDYVILSAEPARNRIEYIGATGGRSTGHLLTQAWYNDWDEKFGIEVTHGWKHA